jgi:uncharacterized membrane protein YkoI
MKLKPKLFIGPFIVSGLLGTSACSTTDNRSETAQIISEHTATEIASNALKGGMVANSHLDEHEGTYKYEVNILKGDKSYEVDVDSLSGKILEINESILGKNTLGDDKDTLQEASPNISSEKAREIALKHTRGTITELDLVNYNNRLAYDIEISSTYHREVKMKIDAINGKILKVEDL